MHFPNLLLLAKVAEKYPDLISGEVLNWVVEYRGYEKWRLGQIQVFNRTTKNSNFKEPVAKEPVY